MPESIHPRNGVLQETSGGEFGGAAGWGGGGLEKLMGLGLLDLKVGMQEIPGLFLGRDAAYPGTQCGDPNGRRFRGSKIVDLRRAISYVLSGVGVWCYEGKWVSAGDTKRREVDSRKLDPKGRPILRDL